MSKRKELTNFDLLNTKNFKVMDKKIFENIKVSPK